MDEDARVSCQSCGASFCVINCLLLNYFELKKKVDEMGGVWGTHLDKVKKNPDSILSGVCKESLTSIKRFDDQP